jgi:hypothetical protein
MLNIIHLSILATVNQVRIINKKYLLTSDCQQFHQYQHHEQSPFTSNH